MGTKRNTSKKSPEKNSKASDYTKKGNRIIRFTEVSEKERKELRLDAYNYIL
ncbi:MAG: hypothetical protein LBL79_03920 [Prevotella sp.]|jgi:hypothetical protein|nr:hypothetical protein [Prevotella sp.]